MPLTVPTHPLAVLPLKLWRPRWFDGVALVIGAVSPDLPYAANGYGIGLRGHSWHAPLWWAPLLALACGPVIRWTAARVAAHLPTAGGLHLRDYGVLARVRHRWWITAWSAVLGAYSHILWDSVTHDTINHRPIPIQVLTTEAVPGWLWYEVLSDASNAVGFLAGAALIVHIGRSRLLLRWHGVAPDVARRPVAFWGTVMGVVSAGAAALPFQPFPHAVPTQAIRCLLVVCAALVAGAVAVSMRRQPVPACR